MTENDTQNGKKRIAEQFGQETDPLAKFEQGFREANEDVWEIFKEERLEPNDPAQATLDNYNRAWREYSKFMEEREERHPACPNEEQIKRFIEYQLEQVSPDTLKRRLVPLQMAYEHWQADNHFPHPADYNPFKLARNCVNIGRNVEKEHHDLSVSELSEEIRNITHVRDQAIVATQPKLGLRAGEVCNIQIQDVHLSNTEIKENYTELGEHPMLDGYEDAIYIPPREGTPRPLPGRDGNKSKEPRILPLDEEMQFLLQRYLLIRPDTGSPYLFLNNDRKPMSPKGINKPWLEHFRPEYDETEYQKAITSHFGRHFFVTFWRVEKDVNREKLKYMRGDTIGEDSDQNGGEAIDEYIHTRYEHIEDTYREEIFKYNLSI